MVHFILSDRPPILLSFFFHLSFCCSNWVISIILYSRSLNCSSALFNLLLRASLLAQLVKNLPAMQETLVQFSGWEDPLEKGTATHSSILAWRIPWTVQSMGSQRAGHYWVTFTFAHCLLLSFCLSNWVLSFIIFLSSSLQFLVPVYSNQHFLKAFYFVSGYSWWIML